MNLRPFFGLRVFPRYSVTDERLRGLPFGFELFLLGFVV